MGGAVNMRKARRSVAKELKAAGVSFHYDSDFQEYTVWLKDQSYSKYHTTDLEDARLTGLRMRRIEDQKEKK